MVRINPQPPRIASLVPSLTELVCALGQVGALVARTGFCVHPREALRGVPKVGGTKDVNLERLRALAPTHVLVNVDENRLDTVQALREFVPNVVVTHPNGPADVPALVDLLVGALPAAHDAGEALKAELAAALAAAQPERFAPQRVLYLIWRGPWMTVARDTYIARMLARVNWLTWPPLEGGAHGAARYPVLRGDEPWLAEVDRVLLSSEPYRFTEAHLEAARALCPNAQAQLVDGELVSWYGPRTAAGLAYLRALAGADTMPRWSRSSR